MTTNEVTAAGLQTQTLAEIITELQTAFQSIYGADINLESNSPDGQLIGILAQVKADLLDLITQVYNSFDPDVAEGAALDSRVALNGIQRLGGTYTIAPVSITVDRALTLYGLDQEVETVFRVEDAGGNQFDLVETHAFAGAGSAELNFRAVEIGAVDVAVNTITSQTTVVVGVTAVNNPNPAGELGVNEETDADLRLRRQASLALGSLSSIDALRAAIANTDGVSDSYVHENYTSSTDGYSVPSHTIWAIVEGGTDADIADVIYAKRSAGCGMYGTEEVSVEQPSGNLITIKFDRPTYVPLYIQFYLSPKTTGASYVEATVKAELAAALDYGIFDRATAAGVVTALADILPLYAPWGVEISIDETNWEELLDSEDPQKKFTVDAANIEILTV